MINYNSTTKLIFSQGQDNTAVKLKPKSSVGASDSEFKNVFDKTLNNSAKRTYSDNGSHDDNKVSQTSNDKYKSFKDVKNAKVVNNGKDSVEKASADIKSKPADEESQKLTEKSDKYDEAINVLAQMLGLQPSELIKLANDAGFSAEDLKDPNNMSLFVNKLAGVMQLNDSQKTMLNALAAEVLKQVNASQGSEVKSASEGTDTVEVKVQANSTPDAKNMDLSKIADEVKEKLNQLIQKASTGTESLGSEISKVIEQMRSQAQAKVTAVTEQTDNVQVTTDTTEEPVLNPDQPSQEKKVTAEKETAKASDSKKEGKAEHTENRDISTDLAVKATDTQVSTSNDQKQDLNQQNAQAIGDIKVVLSNNQTEVQKADFTMPQPVKSAEVVNQVVEQAKVIIGQDKSEMVIQLKPDHLGKLELKVVTEQGIVAAKFIAESHQVKEIIETNMQLLKDSLQKQGISVDSVSVQVGNGNGESQQQRSYQSRNGSSNGQRYGNSDAGVVQVAANTADTLPERFAQYSDETSTVNYTA